jgi:GTP pyrophosphokinase
MEVVMSALVEIKSLIHCETGCIPLRRIENVTYNIFGRDSDESIIILKACRLSADTHRGKKRGNGEPVINHERSIYLIAVVILGITDVALLIAIFMHDMFEDYPRVWPLKRIRIEFESFGPVVARLVQAVSKPKLRGRNKMSRSYSLSLVKRIHRGGKRAMVLKVIDRLHNMITLFNNNRLNLLWKIEQTMKYIVPMSLEIETLSVELIQAVNEQIVVHNISSKELASVNF